MLEFASIRGIFKKLEYLNQRQKQIMLGLFGSKSSAKEAPVGPPVDIKWVRSAKGKFHNLLFLDTVSEGLDGKSGVFTIWTGGVKPLWLYAGSSGDLGRVLDDFIDDADLEEHYGRSGAYVSWAMVKPEFQDGIVRYLNEVMNPEVENDKVKQLKKNKVQMIAVFLPGQEKKGD